MPSVHVIFRSTTIRTVELDRNVGIRFATRLGRDGMWSVFDHWSGEVAVFDGIEFAKLSFDVASAAAKALEDRYGGTSRPAS